MGGLVDIFKGVTKHKDAMWLHKYPPKKNYESRGFAFNFGKTPFISIKDPALIKDFAHKDKYYEKYLPKAMLHLMGTGGIFMASGEEWKQQRKTISQKFHFELLKANVPRVRAITKELFAKIIEKKTNKIDVLK
mmetsp:Transcript_18029/g.15748  ORF Transcript_18029/g.15748 Transcript_18029/m.15748 type:complete len:134 (+) Transcript_18029:187-588(+)